MLKIVNDRRTLDCNDISRRDFLSIGTLGLGGLTLSGLLQAKALAAPDEKRSKDVSVVWLWLGGGPTHIETFDPNLNAPTEVRSVTGEVATPLPGVTIGGTFPKIARHVDKMALVRSFTHKNSGHGGGTHWVMTGYDNRVVDNGGAPSRPSIGSIVARMRGSTNPETGMPTYVSAGRISYDGPSFLGAAYSPFDPSGSARKNLTLNLSRERLEDRRQLLDSLDGLSRQVDQSGTMEGMDRFEQQAFSTLLGNSSKAFDLKFEDAKTVEKYGRGLGQQMLLARRLCEAGCGFVTVSYGGWDMHGNIKRDMEARSPELDHAVAAFLEDVSQRRLSEKILLVITGEFGRTPRINQNGGRDHWSNLSTLALAGGGLKMGQVVGSSSPKLDVPATRPVTPQDLMATIFHVMGIDLATQFNSFGGRPTYLIEGGTPIPELL